MDCDKAPVKQKDLRVEDGIVKVLLRCYYLMGKFLMDDEILLIKDIQHILSNFDRRDGFTLS